MCDCEYCKISKKAKHLKAVFGELGLSDESTMVDDMMNHICDLGFENDSLSYELSKITGILPNENKEISNNL